MVDWPIEFACADGWIRCGTVRSVSVRTIEVEVPGLTPGACVVVEKADGSTVLAEVVSVNDGCAGCVPIGNPSGAIVGARAVSTLARVGAYVGRSLLGHDTDAWGRCAASPSASVVRPDPLPIPTIDRVPVSRAMS